MGADGGRGFVGVAGPDGLVDRVVLGVDLGPVELVGDEPVEPGLGDGVYGGSRT